MLLDQAAGALLENTLEPEQEKTDPNVLKVKWDMRPEEGMVTGTLYLDGSGKDSDVPGAQRVGWGLAAFDPGTFERTATVHGIVPAPAILQLPIVAEIYALLQAAPLCSAPCTFVIDCQAVVTLLVQGRQACCKASNPLAGWWRKSGMCWMT